jgi:hypothetical protein
MKKMLMVFLIGLLASPSLWAQPAACGTLEGTWKQSSVYGGGSPNTWTINSNNTISINGYCDVSGSETAVTWTGSISGSAGSWTAAGSVSAHPSCNFSGVTVATTTTNSCTVANVSGGSSSNIGNNNLDITGCWIPHQAQGYTGRGTGGEASSAFQQMGGVQPNPPNPNPFTATAVAAYAMTLNPPTSNSSFNWNGRTVTEVIYDAKSTCPVPFYIYAGSTYTIPNDHPWYPDSNGNYSPDFIGWADSGNTVNSVRLAQPAGTTYPCGTTVTQDLYIDCPAALGGKSLPAYSYSATCSFCGQTGLDPPGIWYGLGGQDAVNQMVEALNAYGKGGGGDCPEYGCTYVGVATPSTYPSYSCSLTGYVNGGHGAGPYDFSCDATPIACGGTHLACTTQTGIRFETHTNKITVESATNANVDFQRGTPGSGNCTTETGGLYECDSGNQPVGLPLNILQWIAAGNRLK